MKHKTPPLALGLLLAMTSIPNLLFGAPPKPERKAELGNTGCFIEVKRSQDPIQRGVGSDNDLKMVGIQVHVDNRKGDAGLSINVHFFQLADKNGNKVTIGGYPTIGLLTGTYKAPERNVGKGKTTSGWIFFKVDRKLKLRDHIVRYDVIGSSDPPLDSAWIKIR